VLLETVHFLVEIGKPRHTRLSGRYSIRSYDTSAKLLTKGEAAPLSNRDLCRMSHPRQFGAADFAFGTRDTSGGVIFTFA
jgi:hypothetical protein